MRKSDGTLRVILSDIGEHFTPTDMIQLFSKGWALESE